MPLYWPVQSPHRRLLAVGTIGPPSAEPVEALPEALPEAPPAAPLPAAEPLAAPLGALPALVHAVTAAAAIVSASTRAATVRRRGVDMSTILPHAPHNLGKPEPTRVRHSSAISDTARRNRTTRSCVSLKTVRT